MIDIDKELGSLKSQDIKPSEGLRLRTREKVMNEARRRGEKKHAAVFRPVYLTAVAAVLAVLLLTSVFTAVPAQAAGYYTIDINPSISVAVDKNDAVIKVSAENDDAAELLSGLSVKGMRFEEALKAIIQAAVQQQYLADGGQLLVAHFGEDEGMSQQQLDAIVGGQLPDGSVSALLLRGGKEQFVNAEKSGGKAGIELLLSNAREMGIEDENVGTVIQQVKSAQGNAAADKDEPRETDNKDKQGAEATAAPDNGKNNGNKNADKGQSDSAPGGNSGSQGNGGAQGNGNGNNNTGTDEQDKDKKTNDASQGNGNKDKDNKEEGQGGGNGNGGEEGQDNSKHN